MAILAVAEHCGHLGCDVDEMAAAMEEGGQMNMECYGCSRPIRDGERT